MFSSLVFAGVLLHVTYVGSDRCPTPVQMGPCKCEDGSRGLEVFCNGSLVEETRDALANVANTKQRIYRMKLVDVWLPSLPPNFLLAHNVYWVRIHNCSTSSVDEDAFADMAATLRDLRLTHNALERVPSQALKKIINLSHLYLDENRIEILHAEAFSGLDSLHYLSLMGNRIKFIDNSAFVGSGKWLITLDLGGNELTAVPCLPLRNQRSLRQLALRNNKIASLLPEEFDAMGGESLAYLDLRNNTIRHLPASVFKSMKRLDSLELSGNGVESIHPSAFKGTEDTLNYLGLANNRLEEVPSAVLKNMHMLRVLNLSGNKICKIRKDEFLTYGKNLSHIYLQDNSLEYLDANAFAGLDSLYHLSLRSNSLKTLPLKTFAPVSDTLRRLDIEGNPLHCDCNLGWMKSRGSWIVRKPEETICVTPEKYANVSLAEIATDQLICDDNETSNLTEPCCNCFSNTQPPPSSNELMSIFTIIFTYL